ncbi:MAG: periplasmic heavy metal sensor [Roseovarius sp.]
MRDEATGKARGWVKILLVVSLGLNLLVAGVVAGSFLSGGKWHHKGAPRLETMGGPLTRALSDEDRRAIGMKIRQSYKDGTFSRDRHREEFDGLISDLKATPFDPAAVEARLERIQGLFHERLSLGQGLLIERLTEMDDATRAAYADRLVERRERRHKRD